MKNVLLLATLLASLSSVCALPTYDYFNYAAGQQLNGQTNSDGLIWVGMNTGTSTTPALIASPGLDNFSGRVSDSGEGRWTIQAAIDESAPAPVLSAALYQRFTSRGEGDFAAKVLSAMRFQFGGHLETHTDTKGDH